ncbi:MAG TPA: OsmC family protein [Cytophagaceae bacterium]|jgi:putative redox protein|nr:OsmC family protein [Cytophagaceae bacterium]
MIIDVKKKEGAFHFEAINESGNIVQMDASPAIGGMNKGPRPMEMLIMALGGCSGIDVIQILEKQKIKVEDFRIKIDAQREPDATPSLFKTIHINFFFKGDLDKGKAERAVALSLDKYCSVAKTLESSAKITSSITIEK